MILGQDVIIDSNTKFTRPELVTIGNHVAIDWGFYCTTELNIGDYVHISPHVSVIGGAKTALTLEDFCFISTGARIIGASEQFYGDGLVGPIIPDQYKDIQIIQPIVLRRFSGVCANSVVLPGVEMAEGSVLGANSLLKHSTEPWTIYAGSPARPIKSRKQAIMHDYARKLGYDYRTL